MPRKHRVLPGLIIAALSFVLAGCPGDFEGGYDKIVYRERSTPVRPAAPNPPPVVAGIGGAAAAIPDLPAAAPAGVTQAMVEEGQQLYGTVCTACHGSGGVGTPAGPNLNDQSWLHIGGSYDELVTIIQSGVPTPVEFPGAMPPLGGGNFNDEQVRAIAAYIFALSQSGV